MAPEPTTERMVMNRSESAEENRQMEAAMEDPNTGSENQTINGVEYRTPSIYGKAFIEEVRSIASIP